MQPPTVCIIGAGPAGLAAAKTFLDHNFTVTIYEKQSRIGGIWALDADSQISGFLSPQTPTNLSRFTVGFGDLDWQDVDLRSNHTRPADDGKDGTERFVPMFPKAWQVARYLEEYRRRYVPEEVLRLGHRVVKAERQVGSTATPRWLVTVQNEVTGTQAQEVFDYLVIASGFFSSPTPVPPPRTPNGTITSPAIQTIHTSHFRTLADLYPHGPPKDRGRTILLVGGGNSSGEAAATIAFQLSDSQWSPSIPSRHRNLYKDCRILHVIPRTLYAVPPYIEYEAGSRTYVPLDFKLYDFAKRPAGLDSFGGMQAPEVREMVRKAVKGMVGDGEQQGGGRKEENSEAVYVALTESYAEFARSGIIQTVKGRLEEVAVSENGTATALVKESGSIKTVDDIGAVVYATGYTPSTAVEFLSDEVKEALGFDSESMRVPLILEQWQTANESIPNLAFLGFYIGPYWPMIEMQAKLTAERWAKGTPFAKRNPYEEPDSLLAVRRAEKERLPCVPQYWFNDYLGYLESIAKHLRLSRNDGPFAEREGCPSPGRYLSSHTERKQANAIMNELHRAWHDCINGGRYVARAAFRALQGTWDLTRHISSHDAAFCGVFKGTANFHPRFPTPDGSGRIFDFEYLYIEIGTFSLASNPDFSMPASRRYVYRYSEERDALSVWFVKPDNNLEVDYLFHGLTFASPKEAAAAGACIAKADHLCVEDMYWTQYTLPLEAILLPSFEVEHTVKGPQKDYVARASYRRPRKES